jgi:hypothetical protein
MLMPAAIPAISTDAIKLLLLVLIGGGLLALGRWSSRLGAPRASDFPPADEATPDAEELRPRTSASPKVWPPSAEEVAASLPFDPSLGRIEIRKFFFRKTDVTPGPDDPEVFADELLIELYDPESGHSWWQSYFVATPQGLARILRDKAWRYLHAAEILVLPRYDLEEIRRAAVSRIMADHEFFKDKQPAEEESL